MDFWQQLREYHGQNRVPSWHGTFQEYFQLVVDHPQYANLAHARIDQMIWQAGVSERADGSSCYHFFEREVFGLERTIDQLVEYFHSAAQRLEVRKRILLLMGPVGGGKSTLVTLLKRGLEALSATEDGAVFAISGCPMHEDPLHLVPAALRPEIYRRHGVYIEGSLCPMCHSRLQEEYGGRPEMMLVDRIGFSERDRVGIGTFAPSDPKSQDISELTGSLDLATIGEYGVESDPHAYRFDGELNIANRGLMEFIEMLKCDERFLYCLLTLTQEQHIKTGRYSMIYADEAVIAHSNQTEYERFTDNPRNEALKDRIIVIRVPYNLQVSAEEKIYAKLLQESALGHVHVAPYTLRVASMFAVLSRLAPSKKQGVSRIKKMRLYDGELTDEFSPGDLRELQAECPSEGMQGVSPRFVMNRLSAALARPGVRCVNPLDALRALQEGLAQQARAEAHEPDELLNLLYDTRREYDAFVKSQVRSALVGTFAEEAHALVNTYLDHVDVFVNRRRQSDSGEMMVANEPFMRSLEEKIGISENAKRGFREEILIWITALRRRGESFDYRAHPGLRDAVEAKVLDEMKHIIRIAGHSDSLQHRQFQAVTDRLMETHGYCPHCSAAMLQYVGTLLMH